MKKSLLFVCVFIVGQLNAQDYLPVPIDDKMYYQNNSIGSESSIQCLGECIFGMKVESVDSVGSYMDYHFVEMVREEVYYCAGPSWLGEKVRVTTEGDQFYQNKNGASILLKPNAAIGDNWTMFDFQDDTRLEATLVDRYEEELFGTVDSVVQIEMIRKDLNGVLVDDDLNNKSIVLGKERGFIETFNFYDFPVDTFPKHLIGYRDTIAHGIVPPTKEEIFDFEVGNEYHYQSYFSSENFPYWFTRDAWEKLVVLEKSMSLDEDTIVYTIDRTYYSTSNSVDGPDTIFTHDTILNEIILARYTNLDRLPFEPNLYSSGGDDGFITATIDNGQVIIKTPTYLYYDESTNCFTSLIGTGPFTDYFYAKCIGLRNTLSTGNSGGWKNLIYYKKGEEEWGTPIDFDDLLNATDEIILPAQTFKVHPNPAINYLNISSDDFQNEHLLIELYSLDGRRLLAEEKMFAGNETLLIPDALTGIAVLKISTADGIYLEKLVVQK